MAGDQAAMPSIHELIARIYESHPPTDQTQMQPQATADDSDDEEYDPEKPLNWAARSKIATSVSSAAVQAPGIATTASTPAEVASEIVTWRAAVRHIDQLSKKASNVAELTRLINTYDNTVSDWNDDLYNAVKRDREAKASQQAIDDALKAIGVAPEVKDKATEDEIAKLVKRVYREQHQVYDDYRRQLTAIGVPFFNTKEDLIAPEKADGKVSGKELEVLRKRMLQHLEDLYRED